MKFFSPTIIDKTLSLIKDSLQSVRSVYRERLAESEKLNREITEITKAPRTRADLERALITVVNRYVDHHERQIIEWRKRFSGILYADEHGFTGATDALADEFIRFGQDQPWLVVLLRESLLDGAKRWAATVDWPEDAMEPETRQQRLADLIPRRDELSQELDEIRARAQQEGVTL